MADVADGRPYRKVEGNVLETNSRGVLYWSEPAGEAVQLRCPCSKRLVYVTSPPHKITFRDDGVLASLGGSCGYRADTAGGRPQNWCHFTITDGVAAMHSDAKCPGVCDG